MEHRQVLTVSRAGREKAKILQGQAGRSPINCASSSKRAPFNPQRSSGESQRRKDPPFHPRNRMGGRGITQWK